MTHTPALMCLKLLYAIHTLLKIFSNQVTGRSGVLAVPPAHKEASQSQPSGHFTP